MAKKKRNKKQQQKQHRAAERAIQQHQPKPIQQRPLSKKEREKERKRRIQQHQKAAATRKRDATNYFNNIVNAQYNGYDVLTAGASSLVDRRLKKSGIDVTISQIKSGAALSTDQLKKVNETIAKAVADRSKDIELYLKTLARANERLQWLQVNGYAIESRERNKLLSALGELGVLKDVELTEDRTVRQLDLTSLNLTEMSSHDMKDIKTKINKFLKSRALSDEEYLKNKRNQVMNKFGIRDFEVLKDSANVIERAGRDYDTQQEYYEFLLRAVDYFDEMEDFELQDFAETAFNIEEKKNRNESELSELANEQGIEEDTNYPDDGYDDIFIF